MSDESRCTVMGHIDYSNYHYLTYCPKGAAQRIPWLLHGHNNNSWFSCLHSNYSFKLKLIGYG